MIRRAVVIIAIGVLCSVASVVVCATFVKPTYSVNVAPTERDHATWQRHAPAGTSRTPAMVRGTDRRGALVIRRMWGIDPVVAYELKGSFLSAPVGTGYSRMQYVEAGWPLRCARGMRWELEMDITKPIVSIGDKQPAWGAPGEHFGALPYVRPKRLGGPELRLLPLRPMWLGCAGNVGLYGLLAFGVSAAFHRWRRARHARRRAHGWCVQCGYRMGDAPVCPECGSR